MREYQSLLYRFSIGQIDFDAFVVQCNNLTNSSDKEELSYFRSIFNNPDNIEKIDFNKYPESSYVVLNNTCKEFRAMGKEQARRVVDILLGEKLQEFYKEFAKDNTVLHPLTKIIAHTNFSYIFWMKPRSLRIFVQNLADIYTDSTKEEYRRLKDITRLYVGVTMYNYDSKKDAAIIKSLYKLLKSDYLQSHDELYCNWISDHDELRKFVNENHRTMMLEELQNAWAGRKKKPLPASLSSNSTPSSDSEGNGGQKKLKMS